MLSWSVYLLFFLGLLALIKGADWAVNSAVWLSKSFGIPEVVIGATVVSLGTTAPETFVSAIGASQGSSDIAVGTFLGSIIFNTGVVLALGCLIQPITVKAKDSLVKIGIMLTVLVLIGLLGLDGSIRGFDSFLLLALLVGYIASNIRTSNNHRAGVQLPTYTNRELLFQILWFILGVIAVVCGAKILLGSGEKIAKAFGISEAIIATLIYAAGTSLPELVTSLTAALKGHSGIMLGNIVGANILNVIMVASVSSLVKPLVFGSHVLASQIPAALLIMGVLVVPAFVTKKITRIQGLVAFGIYLAFIAHFASI